MWQNNGFGNLNGSGNSGSLQPSTYNQELNFNDPDSYNPFPGTGPAFGNQFFNSQQRLNNNTMGMGLGMDMQFIKGAEQEEYQPEVGLFADATISPFTNGRTQQSAPPHFNPPVNSSPAATNTNPTPTPTLNPSAAQLKAKLLKDKEGRASSQPPTAGGTGVMSIRKGNPAETSNSSSLRGSPKTPVTQRTPVDGILEMISEYSRPEDNSTPQSDKMSKDKPAKSLGSPKNIMKPASKAITNGIANGIANGSVMRKSMSKNGHASTGSISEASEGEIVEKPTSHKIALEPTKQSQIASKSGNEKPGSSRPPRPERNLISYNDIHDPTPPAREPRVEKKIEYRKREDRHEEADPRSISRQESRPERRSIYRSEHNEQRIAPATDNQQHPKQYRREVRDQPADDNRRLPVKTDDTPKPPREAKPQKPPTLFQVLPHDEDLREWLDITGYHNDVYRSKILDRRRKIAKLDAEKAQLLAEMEQEERGGPPTTATLPSQIPAMAPPPAPSKYAAPNSSESAGDTPDQQLSRTISNKRTYSEVHDEREEGGGPSKIFARGDDRSDRGSRIKKEDDERQQMGYDTFKINDRRREREASPGPGLPAYESRPPARSRPYESEDYQDDWKSSKDTRPFEIHGGYRGRAYDPNFRGRGRGATRGRGGFQERDEFPERDSFQPRDFPSRDFSGRTSRGDDGSNGGYPADRLDYQGGDAFFGSRIASQKPYRDPKGFNRGGKGDTRYFIVKSFNQENVLKCIDDSVWTTQLQNGSLFKEAFQTCKNVILVFSINKSKAFQGYARMESVPGSVSPPHWQKAINWESAGAFKVKWLVICSTRFHRVGHLKNALNENQAVLIGKDGQEIEENCGAGLIELIDEEYTQAYRAYKHGNGESYLSERPWDA